MGFRHYGLTKTINVLTCLPLFPLQKGVSWKVYGDSAHLNVSFRNTRVLVGDEGRFQDLSIWCSFTLEGFSSLLPYSRLVCLS